MHSGLSGSERFAFSNQVCQDATAYARSLCLGEGDVQQVDCTVFRGSVTELSLGSIQLIRERIEQPVVFQYTPKRRTLNLLSVSPSEGVFSCGGQKVSPDVLLAYPSHHSDSFYCSGPAEGISLVIDESILTAQLQRLFGRKLPEDSLRRMLFVRDAAKITRFRDGVLQLLEQGAARPDLFATAGDRQALMDRGLHLIADVLESDVFDAARLPPPSTRSYIVEKAIRYMDAHLADPVASADICAALRVSPRTLRYSFEEVLGVSPTRFFITRRLARVRHELLHGPTHGVHRIAQRYGFGHMGRFAHFYQQTYGERPSDTYLAASHGRSRRTAA